MKKQRRVVHVIKHEKLCWDYTEKRWCVWPKIIGAGERLFHSAKKARAEFEMFRAKERRWWGGCRWLTYKNGRLSRVKAFGYCMSYVQPERKFDLLCLNPTGEWWLYVVERFSRTLDEKTMAAGG